MGIDVFSWPELSQQDQTIALVAALIPPPISLDLWAKALSLPAVTVLQLAEKLVQDKILKVYKPLGAGHYYFTNNSDIQEVAQLFEKPEADEVAGKLGMLFETEYEEGPKRWLALAYLYQTTKIQPPDPSILVSAAEYCMGQNLPDEAATYYRLVIELVPDPSITPDTQAVYTDAAIGLCHSKGRIIPLQDQERLLSFALQFSKLENNPQRIIMVYANLGQIYKALGKYELAATMFEKAWGKASALNSEDLLKKVALASIDFLMWQGRAAEAIERYENVLGNLEELPSDEASLQACAQLGWIYGKCGQTVRGIGLINSVMEKAIELKLNRVEIIAKIVAVNTLHDARRNAEAEPIIEELLAIPQDQLDHYTLWPLCAAKAYVHSYRGEYQASFEMQQKAYRNAKLLGNFHHRGPVNFDYMDALEDAGFIHPEMNYDSEVQRVIDWPDIYMQGVGYYFRAKRIFKKNGPTNKVREDLQKSIKLLTQSGAKLDLAFTEILLAELLIQSNEQTEAKKLLKSAWETLRHVNETCFPGELKSIVLDQSQDSFLLDPLVQISETLGTIRNRRKLLNHIISLTLQLTGAERGAFFIPQGDGIEMIASRNIDPDLVQAEAFKKSLSALKKAMQSGKESLQSNLPGKSAGNIFHNSSGWKIVYPVKLQDKILGCFFLERHLSGFTVTERILSLMKAISTQVAVALDNVRAYEEIAELKDQLEAETLFYRREPSNTRHAKDIVGSSTKIKEVISNICDVAPSDTTVLIVGETGVGKELVAKAIHQLSNCTSGPFIPVSIASLNNDMIPSELFGHEKGAFTSALRTHRGRFELANKGTLFLDEINSLAFDIQSKLLRVLEEKVFERVGGSSLIEPNFRLIAATNEPLSDCVMKGTFRADLYYRLNVYPIIVPPLRERKEDIQQLVSYFVHKFNRKFGKNIKDVNKRSLHQLMDYPWPGNVRELKHAVERAVISSKDKQLIFPDFNESKLTQKTEDHFLSLKDMERQYILTALARCEWQVSGNSGAAKLLGVNPQTLYSKIKRLGIQKKVSMEVV